MTHAFRFLIGLFFPLLAFAQDAGPEALVKKMTEEVLAAIDSTEATDYSRLKQFCDAAVAAGSADPLVRLGLAERRHAICRA